jgi:hypothetical protein
VVVVLYDQTKTNFIASLFFFTHSRSLALTPIPQAAALYSSCSALFSFPAYVNTVGSKLPRSAFLPFSVARVESWRPASPDCGVSPTAALMTGGGCWESYISKAAKSFAESSLCRFSCFSSLLFFSSSLSRIISHQCNR